MGAPSHLEGDGGVRCVHAQSAIGRHVGRRDGSSGTFAPMPGLTPKRQILTVRNMPTAFLSVEEREELALRRRLLSAYRAGDVTAGVTIYRLWRCRLPLVEAALFQGGEAPWVR